MLTVLVFLVENRAFAQSERLEIEEAEKSGRFSEAAQRYLDLAERSVTDPRRDELYYNAAVSFERSGRLESANDALRKLLKNTAALKRKSVECDNSPSRRLALGALLRLARNAQKLLLPEEAAQSYETFLSNLPPPVADECKRGAQCAEVSGPEQLEALRQLITLRAAVGPPARREKALQELERRILSRKQCSASAAEEYFSLGGFYDEERDAQALRQHLEKYLREFGSKGGPERARMAHLILGRVQLRTACPIAGELGLCVERKPVRSAACGAPSTTQLVTRARTPAVVEAARQHLQTAIRFEASSQVPVNAANALARFLLADLDLEALLNTAGPPTQGIASTDAAQRQDAMRKLAQYFQEQTTKMRGAQTQYQKVITLRHGEWGIASMLRIAQLYLHLGAQLDAVPLPGNLSKDLQSAYCTTIEQYSYPMREQAVNALDACVAKAIELGVTSSWSRRCEELLQELRPRDRKMPSEITPQPTPSARLDLAPVVTDRSR